MKNFLLILILLSGSFIQAQTDSVPADQPIQYVNPGDTAKYSMVEQMPEYPGGQDAMMKFISKNVKYPTDAIENNVQGKVLLKFVVNTQGEIRDIEVVSKVRYGHGLEEEAIRVLKKCPAGLRAK